MKITNWIVTVFVFLSLTEERKWAGHECNGCLGAGGDREEGGGHYTGRWHREGPPRSHGQLCTYWEREREREMPPRCPWQLCAEREREKDVYWFIDIPNHYIPINSLNKETFSSILHF